MFENLTNKLKYPLILLGLTFLSFLLANYDQEVYFDQVFVGSKNKQEEQNKQKKAAHISTIIQSTLRDKPGNYAIYIKDLKTNEEYSIKSEEYFGTASIYKLAVMYKAFDSINKSEIKKEDILSDEKIVLDKRIAGQDEEYASPENIENSEIVTLNVENALDTMITISDNYSALLLADRLGWRNIDTYLKDNNVHNFDLVGKNSPQATAKSVGNLLELIYTNTAVNPKYSIEMKTLLFAQKINDRIPKYLPREAKVAHKTGELESLRHDAGIVLGQNSHYIFVFLSDTPDQQDASETQAILSQQIYSALEKTPIP